MSKVAHYLQEHLVGEVMTSTDARRYFATDGSILQLAPALIAYPKNENDVRKTARFSWQLAERGRVIPITPRGAGNDQTGAALGSGIMMVFPAHMNRILELDTKANTVTVEPGINYGKLQQTLHTHGRFLPPYPASLEYSTVGGAIANNISGEKSIKYGDTRAYVNSLRVVLANGEVIETKRLNKRELSKKLGFATFEGEIYRSIDTLLEEQHELLQQLERNVIKNNAGYDLLDIKRRDGSFDLTSLLVGSQGTLGIITEAMLNTEPHNPQTTLIMAQLDSLEQTQNAVLELRKLSEKPSAIELVDEYVLQQLHELNPNQLKDITRPPFPPITLFVEFDGNERHNKKLAKRAEKIFDKYTKNVQIVTDPEQQQLFWKIRQATSALLGHNEGLLRAVPLFDAAVPPDRLREYLEGIYSLMKANNLRPAIWGHAGDASLHLQPRLNLGQVGDRQKAFRLMDMHNKLVIGLGGTISAEAGDGRLHTPYLEFMYGSELYALLQKVKKIFDPYGTLNPGVKFGSSLDDIKAMVRTDYGLDHIYEHLPRS
jgi:FAD/FMN-containing dehydrogenase